MATLSAPRMTELKSSSAGMDDRLRLEALRPDDYAFNAGEFPPPIWVKDWASAARAI